MNLNGEVKEPSKRTDCRPRMSSLPVTTEEQSAALASPSETAADTILLLLKGAPDAIMAEIATIVKKISPVVDIGDMRVVTYPRYSREFIETKKLGRGGFGEVYECTGRLDKRIYAIKRIVFPPDADIQCDLVQRAFQEVVVLARICSHKNVVDYHTAWFERDEKTCMLYIQMQRCRESVQEFIECPDAHLGHAKVVKIALDVAQGVEALHDQEYIHRDLNPANCFLTADGTAVVGDLGLSRQVPSDKHGIQETQDLTLGAGTLPYASPEQLHGDSPVDRRSDIYSFGVMLIEMLYWAESTLMNGHLEDILTKLVTHSESDQKIPSHWFDSDTNELLPIYALVLAMISWDPSDRPSIKEVIDRLESVMKEYSAPLLHSKVYQEDQATHLLSVRANSLNISRIVSHAKVRLRLADPSCRIVEVGVNARTSTSEVTLQFALAFPKPPDCFRIEQALLGETSTQSAYIWEIEDSET